MPEWFILNYVGVAFQNQAKKCIATFNRNEGCSLELFAPTYVVKEEKNGQIKMKTANLTFHYVFVRGCQQDVKKLCSQSNGFSFLINRSNPVHRYATVSEQDMLGFMNIAKTYQNCLPFFSLEDIDLEEGDLVEVIKGDFPGLVGTYMPHPKSNSGNIILNIYNNVGTIAFNIKATDVRVLEFSSKTTRANDQIDAFVPHLLTALRLYHSGTPLTNTLAGKLSVFTSRMTMVRLNNRKLDARLQILLYGANNILGNYEEAVRAHTRYEHNKPLVTNPWTNLLSHIILFVITDDPQYLYDQNQVNKSLKPTSKMQCSIMEEYTYYTADATR